MIDENSGYFVTPLKDNDNPLTTEELRERRGDAIPLEDEQIHDVTDDLYRQYTDVEVEVEFERRPYAGEQSEDSKRFRVVGVREEDTDDYELYITNLPREEFLPGEIATTYSCRWGTELLLRELKTQCELDEFDTNKKHAVEILLRAALLSLLVSRELLALLTEHVADEIVRRRGTLCSGHRSQAEHSRLRGGFCGAELNRLERWTLQALARLSNKSSCRP